MIMSQNSTKIINEAFLQQYRDLDEPGEGSLLEALKQVFLNTSAARVQNLLQSLHNKSYAEIYFEAHSLKNSCDILGLEQLSHFCKNIEKISAEKENYDTQKISQRLETLYESARAAVEQLNTK